ncbi:MAG: hypothetical protein AAF907_15045, partial [Planctomycetota bacterium]
MSRDPFADDWEDRQGFEDPRFADGRRPGDEFEDPAPRGKTSGRGISCGCVLLFLGAGALAVFGCCGGVLWLGVTARTEEILADVAADPRLDGQLKEALGPDYRLEPDRAATLGSFGEGGDVDIEFFDAVGSRGAGRLTIRTRRTTDFDPTADSVDRTIVGGLLVMEDGRELELLATLPEDAAPFMEDALPANPAPNAA